MNRNKKAGLFKGDFCIIHYDEVIVRDFLQLARDPVIAVRERRAAAD
jgi:hypothetical protein